MLTRNEAITVMTIAEVASEALGDETNLSARLWPYVEGWAAELGMDTVDALVCRALARVGTTRVRRVSALGCSPNSARYASASSRASGTPRANRSAAGSPTRASVVAVMMLLGGDG